MFVIPGSLMQGVAAFSAPPPASGYYPARITQVEHSPDDKAEVRRVHVRFADGFTARYFVHLAYTQDAAGKWVPLPGLTEKQISGRMGNIRTILESLGYGAADIENPQAQINPAWFTVDRDCYVEWVGPQQGVQGSYGDIQAFLKSADYAARKASGAVPVRQERGDHPRGSAGGTQPGPVGSAGYTPPTGSFAPPGIGTPPGTPPGAPGLPPAPPPQNHAAAPSLPPPPPPR